MALQDSFDNSNPNLNLTSNSSISFDFEREFCTDQQVPPYDLLDLLDAEPEMNTDRVTVEQVQQPYLDPYSLQSHTDDDEIMAKCGPGSPSDAGYESNRDSICESEDNLSDIRSPSVAYSQGQMYTQCSEDNAIMSGSGLSDLLEECYDRYRDEERYDVSEAVVRYDNSDAEVRETRDAVAILTSMTSVPAHVGILDQGEVQKFDSSPKTDEEQLFPELSSSPGTSYCTSDTNSDLDDCTSMLQQKDPERVMTITDQMDIPATTVLSDVHSNNVSIIPQFRMLIEPEHNTLDRPTGGSLSEMVKSGVMEGYLGHARHAEPESDSDCSIMLEDLTDHDYLPTGRRRQANKGRVSKSAKKIYNQTSGRRSRRKAPQLWMFLLGCLCDSSLNPSVIQWKDINKGVFVLRNTRKIAQLWGDRLDRNSQKPMTYDKFSRAIRYYYDKKVLLSHPSRLTYQFGPNACGWRAATRDN